MHKPIYSYIAYLHLICLHKEQNKNFQPVLCQLHLLLKVKLDLIKFKYYLTLINYMIISGLSSQTTSGYLTFVFLSPSPIQLSFYHTMLSTCIMMIHYCKKVLNTVLNLYTILYDFKKSQESNPIWPSHEITHRITYLIYKQYIT